jgi:hypothetical protein
MKGLKVSNKIITEKELNYIETLYLYANLEDFVDEVPSLLYDGNILDGNILDGYGRYMEMMKYMNDTLFYKGKYIGEAQGRDWYKFDNYRIGVMQYLKAKRANQFNCIIQYEQHYMFTLDRKMTNIELPFGGTKKDYHIKRIDITKVAKTPYDYLTNHKFISSYRVDDIRGKDGKTQTIYLGNRRNGNVFRMYDKTIELKSDTKEHPINYKKIELFSSYFGDIENLYTFELELHRKYIKPTFGIDTLEDLDKIYLVYGEIVGKIKIYKDTDENRKHIELKHYDRIKDLRYFTEYREYERLKRKKYKPSKYYAIDRAVRAIVSYQKSMGKLTEGEKLLILDEISSRIMGKDISIEIDDNEYEMNKEDLKSKYEFLRSNQTNNLEIEATRAFRPVAFNNPNEIF